MTMRQTAKRLLVSVMGSEVRPRLILFGLAAGKRIVVSPANRMSYIVGTAEPHLQRAIRKYVKPGDVVYDIGANIGYVALSLSQRVGPSGKVFAFEPLPENCSLLIESVRSSNVKNVTVFPFAASNVDGTAEIRTTENQSMASLVWHRAEPNVRTFAIETRRIDDMKELRPPSFVKIDVEGAEGLVVSGMTRVLTYKPVVFIECSDSGRETTWKIFKKLGYRCESAVTNSPIEDFSDYRHSDFLWLP